MGALRAMFDWMGSWVEKSAGRCTMAALPDPAATDCDPFVPNDSYFRIWVTEGYLAKSRHLGTDQVPTVHAGVSLRYAGGREAEFAAIAGPDQASQAAGSQTDFALTELLPYAGGTVEVEAGLIPLRGDNVIRSALGFLHDVGSLVTPPVSAALDVATKVASGMVSFLQASQPEVQLGFHRAYASAGGGGANVFAPGYVAVLNTDPRTIQGPLAVDDQGTLCLAGQPVNAIDYVLLRFEKRRYRDDWRFPNVMDLRREAIKARTGDPTRYRVLKDSAITALLTSDDLTPTDQVLASTALSREFEVIEGGGSGLVANISAVQARAGDLAPVIDVYAPSPEAVRAAPRPRLASLLGS
jgi:hypothetical protein